MIITQIGIGIDIPYTCTVDRTVEHESSLHIPVAVDILWLGDSTACTCIIGHLIADTVAGRREVDIGHHTLVVILHEIVVEQSEVLCERRFQPRITHRDIERVAVIYDIEQLRDAWL